MRQSFYDVKNESQTKGKKEKNMIVEDYYDKNGFIKKKQVTTLNKYERLLMDTIINKKYFLPIPSRDYNFNFFKKIPSPLRYLLPSITETFDLGYDFFRLEEFKLNDKIIEPTLYRLGSEIGTYGNFFTNTEIKKRIKKISNIAIRDFWIIPNKSFSFSDLDSKKNIKLTGNKCKNNKFCKNSSLNIMNYFIGIAGDQGGIYSGGQQQIIKLTSTNREGKKACFYPKGKAKSWQAWNNKEKFDDLCDNLSLSFFPFKNKLEEDTFSTIKEPYQFITLEKNKSIKMGNGDIYSFISYKIKNNNIYMNCQVKYSNGAKYGGIGKVGAEMKNFLPHGNGTKMYMDGSRYSGKWFNGIKYGKGTFLLPYDRYSAEQKRYEMIGYFNQIQEINGSWYFLGRNHKYLDDKKEEEFRWYKM